MTRQVGSKPVTARPRTPLALGLAYALVSASLANAQGPADAVRELESNGNKANGNTGIRLKLSPAVSSKRKGFKLSVSF